MMDDNVDLWTIVIIFAVYYVTLSIYQERRGSSKWSLTSENSLKAHKDIKQMTNS